MFHTVVGFASNGVTEYRVHVVIETLVEVSVTVEAVSYTHLRAHETREDLVCRLLLEKKK